MNRLFVVLAGIAGVVGVAFAAMAAHGGNASMHGPASQILLFHASVLLVLGLYGKGRVLSGAGIAMAAGAFLFAAAVVAPFYLGQRLFPMAAPIGGTILMLGWALVVVGGVLLPKRA